MLWAFGRTLRPAGEIHDATDRTGGGTHGCDAGRRRLQLEHDRAQHRRQQLSGGSRVGGDVGVGRRFGPGFGARFGAGFRTGI
jgi:hypothetical protein